MNPYEIRLDVLKLARMIHEDKLRNDYNIASMTTMATSNINYSSSEASIAATTSNVEMSKLLEKSTYNEQDVINTATKLYDFVQDRSGRKSDGG